MPELKKLLQAAKAKNNEATLEFIKKFEPLVNRYAKKMKTGEDGKSEMILSLLEIVDTIDFTKFKSEISDAVLVKYIAVSLYHSYLSKIKLRNNDICDEFLLEQQLLKNNDSTDVTNSVILNYTMKSLLSDKEYSCIEYIYKYGYSVSEVADLMGVSRQAVNQCKNRALKKLIYIYK